MKPRLNSEVYVIFQDDCIILDKVMWLGKESFVTEDMLNDGVLDEYRTNQLYYEDFEETWFKSLSKAKKYLLDLAKEKEPDEDFKIVNHDDWWWEVVYK